MASSQVVITVVLAAHSGEKRLVFCVDPSTTVGDFVSTYLPYPDLLVVPRSLLSTKEQRSLNTTDVLPTTPCVRKLLDTRLDVFAGVKRHVMMQDLLLVAISGSTTTRLVLYP